MSSPNFYQRSFDDPNAFAQGAAGGFGGLPFGFGDVIYPDGSYEVANPDGTTDLDSADGAIIERNIYGLSIHVGGGGGDDSGGGILGDGPPTSGGGSTAPPWWAILGPGILKDISNIFAPVPTSVAQAQAQYQQNLSRYQQQYPGGQVQNGQYVYGNQRYPLSTGVGFGIDGSGIRLSDGSHISWVLIAAVGFGVFLLQSKGYSRR